MFKTVATKLIATALLLGLAVLPLAGCKEDNSQHVIFIEPDGTVTWRVIEDLVRSTEDDPVERLAEEEQWRDDMETGEEGWAMLLDNFGATEVDDWYLRDARPYTVVTQAKFDDLGDLIARTDKACNSHGNVTTLVKDGDVWTLTATVPMSDDEYRQVAENEDYNVWILTWVQARIVASEGRFIEAERFELSDDGAIATPLPLTDEDLEDRPGEVVYRLVWDTSV